MDETPHNEPIRLEMSKRSKIGCGVAAVAFLVLVIVSSYVATSRGRLTAHAAIQRIYTLAQVEDYPGLESLVSKSAILTLQKADATNGKISRWNVEKTETGVVGRPSTCYVLTTRNGKQFMDIAVSRNSIFFDVIVEYPKADWDANREDHIIRVIAK